MFGTQRYCEVWLETMPEGYDVESLITSCLEMLESAKKHIEFHSSMDLNTFTNCSNVINELSSYIFAGGAYGWWYPAAIVAKDNRFSKMHAFNDTSLGAFHVGAEGRRSDSRVLSLYDVEFPLVGTEYEVQQSLEEEEEPSETHYHTTSAEQESVSSSDPLEQLSGESPSLKGSYPLSLVTMPEVYQSQDAIANSSSSPAIVAHSVMDENAQWYRVTILRPVPSISLMALIRALYHVLKELSAIPEWTPYSPPATASPSLTHTVRDEQNPLPNALSNALHALDTLVKHLDMKDKAPTITLAPGIHIRPLQLDNPYYSALALAHAFKESITPPDLDSPVAASDSPNPTLTHTHAKDASVLAPPFMNSILRPYPWLRWVVFEPATLTSDSTHLSNANRTSDSARFTTSPMVDFLFHSNCLLYHTESSPSKGKEATISLASDTSTTASELNGALLGATSTSPYSLQYFLSHSFLPLPILSDTKEVTAKAQVTANSAVHSAKNIEENTSLPTSVLQKRLSQIEQLPHSVYAPGLPYLPLRYYVRKHKFWRLFDQGVNMGDQPARLCLLWKMYSNTLRGRDNVSVDEPGVGDTVSATQFDLDPWFSVTPESVAVYIAQELVVSRNGILDSEAVAMPKAFASIPPSESMVSSSTLLSSACSSSYQFSWDFCSGIGSNAIHLWRAGQEPFAKSETSGRCAVFAVEFSHNRVLASLQNARVYFRELLQCNPFLYTRHEINSAVGSNRPLETEITPSLFSSSLTKGEDKEIITRILSGNGKHRVPPLLWICGDALPLFDALEAAMQELSQLHCNQSEALRNAFLQTLLHQQAQRFLLVCSTIYSSVNDVHQTESKARPLDKVTLGTGESRKFSTGNLESIPPAFREAIIQYIEDNWTQPVPDAKYPSNSSAASVTDKPFAPQYHKIRQSVESLCGPDLSLTAQSCLQLAALVCLFPELSGLCSFLTVPEVCSTLDSLVKQYAPTSASPLPSPSPRPSPSSFVANTPAFLVDTAACSPPWGGPYYGLVAKEQFGGKYSLSQQLILESPKPSKSPEIASSSGQSTSSCPSFARRPRVNGVDLIATLTRIARHKACIYLPESTHRGEILQGAVKGGVEGSAQTKLYYQESQTSLTSDWYSDTTLMEFLKNSGMGTFDSTNCVGEAITRTNMNVDVEPMRMMHSQRDITSTVSICKQKRGDITFDIPSEAFSQAYSQAVVHFDAEELSFPTVFRSSKRKGVVFDQQPKNNKKRRLEEPFIDPRFEDADETDDLEVAEIILGNDASPSLISIVESKRKDTSPLSIRVDVQQIVADNKMLASCVFITKNVQRND